MLNEYCSKVGLPSTAKEFTEHLRTQLAETAKRVDQGYPENNGAIVIDSDGVPVLKRTRARVIPKSAEALGAAVVSRMPERHLLDILANTEYWTNFTRHFAPLSGSDPKLDRSVERYILTVSAIGCNLGPNQAARHMAGLVSAHMLSWVNRRHVTIEKLEAAQRDLIELYVQLDLPQAWGDGLTVAANGTQYDMYEENLLAGYHFRYRKTGAVAYRHVANNHIANFGHFIPPGIWEAVYVIEGLMKSRSSVQAEAVHSDTQGQSETVFAFTHLLGIKLMPRIRNWKGLKLYRPDEETQYGHIGTLFSGVMDGELIESHWQELMQVVLSIQAGKISSAMLLRKLGNESRKNRLYRVAREIGRVVRTIFLLDWISNLPLRRAVTETTNKIESYNGFAKWISFGGEGVIAENDPDEQQKRLRYNDLGAGAVILQKHRRYHANPEATGARRVDHSPGRSHFPQSLCDPYGQALWRLSTESGTSAGAMVRRNGPAAQRTATRRTGCIGIHDGSVMRNGFRWYQKPGFLSLPGRLSAKGENPVFTVSELISQSAFQYLTRLCFETPWFKVAAGGL